MHIISVYVAGRRYTLEHPTTILARANQALAALERYKLRLDEVASTLSALEIEDLVTVRDAMSVSQRLEMVRRIADEIEGFVVELGTDGRLLALQLDEMLAGVEEDRGLLVRDYLPGARRNRTGEEVLSDLRALSATELLDLSAVARCYGLPTSPDALDSPVSPRGYRLLARVPRLPAGIIDRLVDALRRAAEAAGRHHRGPAGRRGRRRGPGPRHPRGPVPAGRDLDPRPLQLMKDPVLLAPRKLGASLWTGPSGER